MENRNSILGHEILEKNTRVHNKVTLLLFRNISRVFRINAAPFRIPIWTFNYQFVLAIFVFLCFIPVFISFHVPCLEANLLV